MLAWPVPEPGARSVAAAPPPTAWPALSVLHLSDPHFGTERAAVRDGLLALAAQLQPDAIVITGDLTQRATPAQFAAAADFLRALPPVPRLVIPGNHDIPLWDLVQRLAAPYRRYSAVVDGPRQPVLSLPGLQVVAADTTRWWRHRHGTLGRGQIDTIAARLAAAPSGSWRLVATHHPLRVRDAADREDRPWRHQRALAVWQQAGAEAFLSGHLHVPALLAAHPGGPGPVVVQAGTALSSRTLPGVANSVNLLLQRPGDGGLPQRWLQVWALDLDGQFRLASQQPLPAPAQAPPARAASPTGAHTPR